MCYIYIEPGVPLDTHVLNHANSKLRSTYNFVKNEWDDVFKKPKQEEKQEGKTGKKHEDKREETQGTRFSNCSSPDMFLSEEERDVANELKRAKKQRENLFLSDEVQERGRKLLTEDKKEEEKKKKRGKEEEKIEIYNLRTERNRKRTINRRNNEHSSKKLFLTREKNVIDHNDGDDETSDDDDDSWITTKN